MVESKFSRFKEERDNKAKAKKAIELQESAIPNNSSERMSITMYVLYIPAVQLSLECLADLLRKIQKALGEYLERERSLRSPSSS